jgi:hypothetical protein
MQSLSDKKNFFEVLKLRSKLDEFQKKTKQFKQTITTHQTYLQENSRPNVVVRSELDKFRGFLKDVVSFEPDFILAQEKPRLHYYDTENSTLLIHELSSQTTTPINLRNPHILPKDFVSIQIHNKVFCVGGEKKENEIRSVVANDLFVINEHTSEVERKASMNFGRSGH